MATITFDDAGNMTFNLDVSKIAWTHEPDEGGTCSSGSIPVLVNGPGCFGETTFSVNSNGEFDFSPTRYESTATGIEKVPNFRLLEGDAKTFIDLCNKACEVLTERLEDDASEACSESARDEWEDREYNRDPEAFNGVKGSF